MCVGHWPTFHGPVSLSYILKTTWLSLPGDGRVTDEALLAETT